MQLTAPSDAKGQRLDQYLQTALPQYSRSRLQSWVKDGRVQIGGKAAKASYLMRGGETVDVSPADLPPLKATAEEIPLSVLYEDDAVIAIDKPAGMVVHAGAGVHSGTLVNALLHRFGKLSQLGGDLRPGIVHRLDKGTSGVLLVARHDSAHRALAEQFASREVQKIYLAMVHGEMPRPTGTIERPISRDPVRRIRMTARLGEGRSAYTEYTVQETNGRFSFLQVRIGTGRTHQIRVHLSTLKHPIVGDSLYGAPAAPPGLPDPPRFFLHAHQITFNSPATDAEVTVRSPLPPDLTEWKSILLGTTGASR